MSTAPAQFSSNAGTVSGPINGQNTEFQIAPAQPPQASILFQEGLLQTQPNQGQTAGDIANFTTPPPSAAVVTIEAWSPDPAEPAALNLPMQFTTANGSIEGILNGANNVFTLNTGGLVTGLVVFWNGSYLTPSQDYNWTCQQTSSAGPWVTTITTASGNYPLAGDFLTIEAFFS